MIKPYRNNSIHQMHVKLQNTTKKIRKNWDTNSLEYLDEEVGRINYLSTHHQSNVTSTHKNSKSLLTRVDSSIKKGVREFDSLHTSSNQQLPGKLSELHPERQIHKVQSSFIRGKDIPLAMDTHQTEQSIESFNINDRAKFQD